jgi:amphi-Trp domain-containing protein
MRKQCIGLQTRLSREDVAGLIEALLEGLKEGRINIPKSDASLCLDVPRVLNMALEGGLENDRTVFRMELSWLAERPDVPDITMPEQREPTDAVFRSPAAKGGPKKGRTKKTR